MPRILPVAIALTTSAIALSLSPMARAQATPLKPGLYRWGSNYIQLAQRGDRWCFQGFTARATTIASLSRNGKAPHRYQVHGMGAIVQQERPDQLAYGTADNLLPYAAEASADTTLTPKMVACLNSRRPYFQRIHSTR